MKYVALDMALIQFYRCKSLGDLLEEASATCAAIGFPFMSLHWTPAAGPVATMLGNHVTVWDNFTHALGLEGQQLSAAMENSLALALQQEKSDTQVCQRWKTQQRATFQMVTDAPADHYLTRHQKQLPCAFNQPEWRDLFFTPLCRERDRALMLVAMTQSVITPEMKTNITRAQETFANAYRYLHVESLHQARTDGDEVEEPALSRREVECLHWLASGKTLTEAATILGISERTLRFHIANARERLGVSTTVQAIVAAAFAYGFNPHDGRRSLYATAQSFMN
ncbi:MAG: LuxR C-terminal-related transcriptional regulator [Pseudomonadota bacterium]